MKYVALLIFTVFLPSMVFSSPVPFEKVQSFHDRRVDILLKNYDLQESVDVSVLISPERMKSLNVYKKEKRFRLPGLLLGGLDSPEEKSTIGVFEILDSLKNYKRRVTLIKKKTVSDEEIKALESGLKEYLVLRENEPVLIEDKVFNFASEMRNWRADLGQSLYQSFFKGDFWAWVPLSLVLVLVFSLSISSALKRSFKGLGSSIEKSGAAADTSQQAGYKGEESGGAEDKKHSDDGYEVVETEVTSLFEVDPGGIFEKISDLYAHSKYELFNILWMHLPQAGDQVSFYEVMNSNLDSLQLQRFEEMFFEAFKLDPTVRLSSLKSKGISITELKALQRSLLFAGLIDVQPKRERALSAIYPRYGSRVNKVVEASLEHFFSVVYFLFPDNVTEIISNSSNLSSRVSDKIMGCFDGMGSNEEPNDLEIEGFVKFVESDEFVNSDKAPTMDKKLLKLIANLPDSLIFQSEQIKSFSKDYIMTNLPNLNWLTPEDPEKLKKFFLSLSDSELLYVSKECSDFDLLFEVLDERGKFRVQEKLDGAFETTEKIKVSELRNSIKRYFEPLVDKKNQPQVLRDAA